MRALILALVAFGLLGHPAQAEGGPADPISPTSFEVTAQGGAGGSGGSGAARGGSVYAPGIASAPDIVITDPCIKQAISAGWLGASGALAGGISPACLAELDFALQRVINNRQAMGEIAGMVHQTWVLDWERRDACDRFVHSWWALKLGWLPGVKFLACEFLR